MRVGIMLPATSVEGSVDAAFVLDVARAAEALGFDGVYAGDHLLHPNPSLDALVVLAGVAAATTSIRVGTCVLLAALREPLLLAKQVASLAALAPGRLRIGVGAGGEYPGEFEAAGVPLGERGRRLEEAVRHLRGVLADGHRRGDLTLTAPAPGVEVFFGGWSDRALERASSLGDGWIGYLLRPDSFGRRRDRLVEARGAGFPTGMLLPISVGDRPVGDHWAALTAKSRASEELFVSGTPDEVVARVGAYRERGCDELVVAVAAPQAEVLAQLEVLAAEVLPRLAPDEGPR